MCEGTTGELEREVRPMRTLLVASPQCCSPVVAGPNAGEAAPVPELRSQRRRLRRRVCHAHVVEQNSLRCPLCACQVARDQGKLLIGEVQVQEVAVVQGQPGRVAGMAAQKGG